MPPENIRKSVLKDFEKSVSISLIIFLILVRSFVYLVHNDSLQQVKKVDERNLVVAPNIITFISKNLHFKKV